MLALMEAASAHLPVGVVVSVENQGARDWLVARYEPKQGSARAGFANHNGGMSRSTLALGTWVPFLPPKLKRHLKAIAALDLLSDVVSECIGQPWPGSGYSAHAEEQADEVHMSFSSTHGPDLLMGTVPRLLL